MESVFKKTQASILGKVRLLVIDSNPKNTALMIGVLNRLGFTQVFSALDGFSAIDVIRQEKIDLIITDWDLKTISNWDYIPNNETIMSERWNPIPPVDGACFVKYLRSSKFSPNPYLPVIMLTGLAIRDKIEYARDSGVDEILVKPVSAEKLCNRISLVVDNRLPFVTSDNYKGPCRRRKKERWAGPERRKRNVVIVKHKP